MKKDIARWALDYAVRNGASAAAVRLFRNRSVGVSFREGLVENLHESTQNSLTIDLYADHKYSSHSTSDLKTESLETFISEAIAGTRYLSPDTFRSLPDPMYYPNPDEHADLQLRDSSYESIQASQRKDAAEELEQYTRGLHPALISVTAGYYDSLGQIYQIHSNGFEGESEWTHFSIGADVALQDDKGGKPEDGYWASVANRNDLPNFQTLGDRAVSRAVRKLGQQKLDSGSYEMILENQAGGRLLWGLKNAMSGETLYRKASWLEGKQGQQIASDALTLIDDPHIPRSQGSRNFDGEGLAAKRRVMIEKGVLKNYFIDTYYGRKLEMPPTSGSTSNLIFEYGQRGPEDMIRDVKKGILITGFIGGNSNSTTGDFSVGVVGQLIENGRIIQPVNEMNLSGNTLSFWQNLVETGNDPRPYSGWKTPSFRFSEMHFSGK